MNRIVNEIKPLVASLRDDLRQLEKRISHYQDNHELNPEEYSFYKSTLDECYASMRNKMHIITTMLETDSAEILEMVKQKSPNRTEN